MCENEATINDKKPNQLTHRVMVGTVPLGGGAPVVVQSMLNAPANAREQAEITLKYEGYLAKEEAQIHKARSMENMLLPDDTPYAEITGLRLEARQKLAAQRPRSLAAA